MRLLAILLLIFSLQTAAQARTVALELVLAIDTSTSVDDSEFELQRTGLADAFVHPDILAAIAGLGELGIAVSVIEWAGTGTQETIIDWMLVDNEQAAFLLSQRLRTAPRLTAGMTDIGGAIRYAADSIERNGYNGYRQVIDVSGDGSGNTNSSSRERDRAVSLGITVNGLVIFNDDYDLGKLAEIDLLEHYANHVIGGAGAFLMTAENFTDFATSMRMKLLREIGGPATANLWNAR